ncbi:hypothetical protein M513_07691 [Trichuris suis]|uniref:Uncharacterized protein n=1 Tax=Trichuris suis TaxID=68888 RepID=A0A085M2N2_9BILA|nr:hypothetical protein M513_07691 [Trichuris suis]
MLIFPKNYKWNCIESIQAMHKINSSKLDVRRKKSSLELIFCPVTFYGKGRLAARFVCLVVKDRIRPNYHLSTARKPFRR